MTINQVLFRYRSYTPVPFLILMIIFARPTIWSLFIGFLIACAGEFLRAWGVFYVGSETRVTGSVGASRLITTGPFAHVRNPLYLGNIFIYVGIGIMSMALFPWLQLAALFYFYLQYTLIIQEEERFLLIEFGEEYRAYLKEVPRFIFRLSSYNSPKPFKIDWGAGWKSEARSLQAFSLAVLILIVIWIIR